MIIIAYNEKILKDDMLRVFLIGSGGPFNNDVRVAPCIAVIAAGEFFLVDVGPGTYRIVDVMRLPIPHLSKILLTHFHSDHIGDLGEANMMSWANGRIKALEVYGPEGVEKVVNGFTMAYEHDTGYRIAHHGKDIMLTEASTPISKTIKFSDPNEKILCFETNGLKVYAFQVDHSPVKLAVGYRIEYKGNVVVITGDTKKTDTLAEHCKNADILFSDPPLGQLWFNLKTYEQLLDNLGDLFRELIFVHSFVVCPEDPRHFGIFSRYPILRWTRF